MASKASRDYEGELASLWSVRALMMARRSTRRARYPGPLSTEGDKPEVQLRTEKDAVSYGVILAAILYENLERHCCAPKAEGFSASK